MSLNKLLILAWVPLFTVLCQVRPGTADIYQYTDDKGVIHFSNVNVGSKKYKRIKSEPPSPSNSKAAQRSSTASLARRPSSNIPTVYADIINTACDRHGVDPALVRAIVKVESDFNPTALSKKGAMGLMQLMPQTAVDMNVSNSFNPIENIDGGVKYLRYLMDRYEGNLSLTLAAYNSGETAVKKWGMIPPFPETRSYVQKILNIYNNGGGNTLTSRYTVYMSHDEDGAILFTDDPAKRPGKNLHRKTPNNL
jgi:hypothetical protein